MRTFFACALVAFSLVGCASAPSQDSEDTYRRGLALANSDTAGAIKVFEDGLAADPKHHRMRFALGRLQYDTGEAQHLAERDAIAMSRKAEEDHKPAETQKALREAQDRHQKALPFYRAARDNMKIVAQNDGDEARKAWAYAIVAKCDVFFDDYDDAVIHLEKAIELGHPSGDKLARMKEFLNDLKKEVARRKGKS